MTQFASTINGRRALLPPLLLLTLAGCFQHTYTVGQARLRPPSCPMNGATTGFGD